jgi:hypothetical protein
MSLLRSLASTTLALVALAGTAGAQTTRPAFDEKLAKSVGADARGMRSYVLVILKTGPTRVPNGPERDDMFKGHFANMERLSDAGKLAVAGPFGNNADGWRGLFVFAVAEIDEARALVATDPVIIKGEMIAEYHKWYGSAAMMVVPETHKRIAKAEP